MSTRSPHPLDRLYFLLCREPTVRTARNLERMSSLSLSKITNQQPTTRFSSSCTFFSLFVLRRQLFICLIISLTFHLIPNVSIFLIFDTRHNLGHPSHPLSTHATCVTWVHVVGDFCHITCLSNPFYSTRHPMPQKT